MGRLRSHSADRNRPLTDRPLPDRFRAAGAIARGCAASLLNTQACMAPADDEDMGRRRHRGRKRAKPQATLWASLEKGRRRRITWRLALGRRIPAEDHPFARERAHLASSKLDEVVWSGLASASFLGVGYSDVEPLNLGLLLLVLTAVAIYALGMTFALRSRLWLRRHPADD